MAGPSEFGAPTVPQPLVYDIADWTGLNGFVASSEVTRALAQKGFCFIGGFAEDKVRFLAEKEARSLKKTGAMKRTPEEALCAMLGTTTSCWTMELSHPQGEVPETEEHLRKIDQCLDDVGMGIARNSAGAFGEAIGRTCGLLHYSRMPEDRAPPKLMDPDDASSYASRVSQKRVVLLYYLGPSAVSITLCPREEPQRVYQVMTKSPAILAYRSDACLMAMEMRGVGITVEVDFVLRTFAGPQTGPRDLLPLPVALENWFFERLQAIADSEQEQGAEDIPIEYRREAAMAFHKTNPVRIVELWHELPALPFFGGGVAPLEAAVLGGQDPVTEICKKRDKRVYGQQSVFSWGGKWDPDEYYDEDPMSASDFKMYTRHFAVLNRNHELEYDAKEFGIFTMEDFTMDHRARMLLEATTGCLRKANVDVTGKNGKDVGFFIGMTGENQYWHFMRREAKINKYSAQNLSNATTVNRLSYHLDCSGPCVCVDTEESSGTVALDTALVNLREGRSGPFSFAGSCHWISNPFEAILQCAAGVISRSGRTRVWDESADGFTKGEGVVVALLELLDCGGSAGKAGGTLVVGSGVNSKGMSSSLGAPNAIALIDVVQRAAKDAQKPFHVVDAVEASAGGSRIGDLVELATLHKLLDSSDRELQAVPVRAGKSTYGSLGPVSGLAGVVRSWLLLEKALHGPVLHLRQFLELPEDESEAHQRLLCLTEVIEAKGYAQIVGVSSFGSTGTNCHCLLRGDKAEAQTEPRPAVPLTWWPGGMQKEESPPADGYYVAGTWTAWQWPCKMDEEAPGVFGYTLTMGENNWESFQVWLEQDPKRVLHPAVPAAPRESTVVGPESVGRDLSWYITGRREEVRLINEVQAMKRRMALAAASWEGDGPPVSEPRLVVAFPNDDRPPGAEDVEDETGMPVVNLNEGLVGQPGDKYRIRLHVRGKYYRLEWSKVTEEAEDAKDSEERVYVHKYTVTGDHNYWTFEDMEASEEEEGLYCAKVQLLRENSRFQIYRDADWEQAFYPSVPDGGADAEVLGPDGLGHGKNWRLTGQVGDYFRIELRRRIVEGQDCRSIRWEHTGNGEVDHVERAKSHKYFYVGSSTDFQEPQEMIRDGETGNFHHEVSLAKSGTERFQIWLNGNVMTAVHPNTSEATIHDEHAVEGPDDDAEGKYWAIGVHPQDEMEPFGQVNVHLEMMGGLPHKVRWERLESPEAHRKYLAWGCQSILERHCRLLGFEPYRSEDQPGRLVRRADFMDTVTGVVRSPLLRLME